MSEKIAKITVSETAKKINSLYIGSTSSCELGLDKNNRYSIEVNYTLVGSENSEESNDEGSGGRKRLELSGTLTKAWNLGGLAPIYRDEKIGLTAGEIVDVKYYDGSIVIDLGVRTDNLDLEYNNEEVAPDGEENAEEAYVPVLFMQNANIMHIEPYSPGNLRRWVPQTEADVYMVFGALSEYTEYRYCCGASQSLLNSLGYTVMNDVNGNLAKPYAIIIERSTSFYLIAEVKMRSGDFSRNHHRDDVDVLICWEDNEDDRELLPHKVLSLRNLLEQAIEANEIEP